MRSAPSACGSWQTLRASYTKTIHVGTIRAIIYIIIRSGHLEPLDLRANSKAWTAMPLKVAASTAAQPSQLMDQLGHILQKTHSVIAVQLHGLFFCAFAQEIMHTAWQASVAQPGGVLYTHVAGLAVHLAL